MPLRLMCLTAHPDDEALAFGGALLMAADRGAQTSILCLTEGSAGSYREPGQTDEDLAALRREEFAAACRALGVANSELLRYRDGELWHEPFLPLVGVLVAALRRVRPHVVLTFGGEGGANLHRDHTVVSLAATAAFHWAGRSGMFPEQLAEPFKLRPWAAQKLYYSAPGFVSTKDPEALHAGTQTPASLLFQLNDDLHSRKLQAFGQHTSQRGVLERVQSEFGEITRKEGYVLAAARRPVAGEVDFWTGIEED